MGRRPDHVKPPHDLPPSPPVPQPEPGRQLATDPLGPNPTRYGDWERAGIAVDF